MEDFLSFLTQFAALPIAVLCFIIGRVIKCYIKKIPNRFIPLILGTLGLILNLAFNNFQFTYEIIITGIGSGLAATGTWEAIRNIPNKNKTQ